MTIEKTQDNIKDIPFFRPSISEEEINAVADCLRSGWLTTGERCRQFEKGFATCVGGKHALALSSCTAALHLAVESLGLNADQAVLVPTMTFAATAEVVRYQNAVPILVDCDPHTFNIDLNDAERKLADLRAGRLPVSPTLPVVGIMPVHYGGLMVNMNEVRQFADSHGLWVVEDAAHAFPAAYRENAEAPWQYCGANTADVTCYSFYVNKTITTGEGGMAVTDNKELNARMRIMAFHGLSHDVWERFSGGGPWDYRIIEPGYKYNLTDIAATIGIHQLRRAEAFRQERMRIAEAYIEAFQKVPQLQMPPNPTNRIHAWHLFPIRLHLKTLSIDRNQFIERLRSRGIGCSVHWRPLHLHPYYQETQGWQPDEFAVATKEWQRTISLPLFPGMTDEDVAQVIRVVTQICADSA